MEYHSISHSPPPSSAFKQDPFYEVKDKVKALYSQLSSNYDSWKDMLENSNTANNIGFSDLTSSVKMSVSSIEVDLRDLQQTIAIVDANRSRFRQIDDEELNSRRKFVNDTNAAVISIKEDLSSKRTREKIEQDKSGGNRNYSTRRQQRPDLFSGEGEVSKDNASYMQGVGQQQEMMIRQQDNVLDDMTSALTRLGDVAGNINKELIVQEEMINELDVELEHAQGTMDVVMKKMNKLLGRSDKGRYCCLFWLIVIIVVLMVILIYF